MFDPEKVPLSTTEGRRGSSSAGDRLLLALAVLALLGGGLIALSRALPVADESRRASSTPTGTTPASVAPSGTPVAQPPSGATLQVVTGSIPPPRVLSPFAGGEWVRLRQPLPVRNRPDPDSAQLYLLEPGEAAYLADAPLLGNPTAGWRYVYAPSNGWVAADPANRAMFKRYDQSRGTIATSDLTAVVAGSERFVATVSSGPVSLALSSPDGSRWQAVTAPISGPMLAAADGPVGWLAIGGADDPLSGLPLRQSDDGVTWSDVGRIFVPGSIVQLVGTDAGYVLTTEQDGFAPHIWFSSDGLLWTERPVFAASEQIRVVATPLGFIAWTAPDPRQRQGDYRASAALSPDGRSWSGAPMPAAGRVVDVVAEGDHLVAATVSTAGTEIWQGTINGTSVTWFPQESGAFEGSVITSFVSDGHRTLALGWQRATEMPLWWQRAGGIWQRHDMPADFGGLPNVVAGGPPGIVAVGTQRVGLQTAPQVWHLEGETWTPEQVPTGTAPVRPSRQACGRVPRDLIDLIGMDGSLAATCFGDRPVTIKGWTVGCAQCVEAPVGEADHAEPAWLANQASKRTVYLAPARIGTYGMLAAVLHPSLRSGAAPLIRRVTLTGHFDDPAAAACRATPTWATQQAYRGRETIVAACRARFVVTAIREVGP